MRQFLLTQRGQHLQNRSDARLVVAAQNRVAGAVDHTVADHRLDAGVSADRVHVRAEQQPVVTDAIDATDEIADGVEFSLETQGLQTRRQMLADLGFLPAGAVDADQFQKCVDQPILIDHGVTSGICS